MSKMTVFDIMTFGGWAGYDLPTSSPNSCFVNMCGDRTVTVTFVEEEFKPKRTDVVGPDTIYSPK